MADNFVASQGTGTNIGADEISTVLYQRNKLIYGPDGTNSGDVALANAYPVGPARASAIEVLVIKLYTFFTASYQDLSLTNIATARALFVWNDMDAAILLSMDGGSNAHAVLPAKASRIFSVRDAASAVWSKYISAPSAASGSCYFEVLR